MREARIARRNLELLGVPAAEHDALVSAILESTGANLMETLRVWTHGRADNLRLVRNVRGRETLDAALAQGRGAIKAAPH
jgi:KDO2-lipid IV(A) lauroyltransferase